jgi:hypothetical protein
MRLVKALRRRIVGALAVCVASCVGAMPVGCIEGCDDDDDSASADATLTAADCAPTLRLPVSPRIVEVLDDGSLRQGPPCASANCLAGNRGAWGFRDATSTKIEVGAQHIELPALAEGSTPSRYAAQHALRGFVLGKNIAVIDRGDEVEVVTATGSQRLPAPTLGDGERVLGAWRGDDRTFVWTRGSKRGTRGRAISLEPPKREKPAPDASAIWDAHDVHVGWLLPSVARAGTGAGAGAEGKPAAIQRNDGVVLPLAMEVPPRTAGARLIGNRYVLTVDKKKYVLGADGALLVELPKDFDVATHDDVLYAVDPRAPGGFHLIAAGGLVPHVVPAPGHDLGGALPAGAVALRVEIAVEENRALVASRVQLATCTFEDRLVLVDLRAQSARTIATGDVMRMHPTYAGDRFRYVEADASYETR